VLCVGIHLSVSGRAERKIGVVKEERPKMPLPDRALNPKVQGGDYHN